MGVETGITAVIAHLGINLPGFPHICPGPTTISLGLGAGGLAATGVVGKSPGPMSQACVLLPSRQLGSEFDRAALAMSQIVVPLESAKPEQRPELTIR